MRLFLDALGGKADALLTGDLKDFEFLMNAPEKTSGILIQTVSDFLTPLARRSGRGEAHKP